MRNLLFCMLLSCVLITPFTWAEVKTDSSCAQFLARSDIQQAQLQMLNDFTDYKAYASMEFPRAIKYTAAPENRYKHVMSFGSGPDVFTALVNFPLADNIHLVDSLVGWGKGTGEVLSEIINRLRSSHQTAEIKLFSLGFIEKLPPNFKNEILNLINKNTNLTEDALGFSLWHSEYPAHAEYIKNEGFFEPLIIEMKWTQSGVGAQSKKIYVHAINFNNPEQLKTVNSFMNSHELGGIIIEGAPFPHNIAQYLEKLMPHGIALLEVYSDDKDQVAFIDSIKKDESFHVASITTESYKRLNQNTQVHQTLYFVKKLSISGLGMSAHP